jgi:hypothetical protein
MKAEKEVNKLVPLLCWFANAADTLRGFEGFQLKLYLITVSNGSSTYPESFLFNESDTS